MNKEEIRLDINKSLDIKDLLDLLINNIGNKDIIEVYKTYNRSRNIPELNIWLQSIGIGISFLGLGSLLFQIYIIWIIFLENIKDKLFFLYSIIVIIILVASYKLGLSEWKAYKKNKERNIKSIHIDNIDSLVEKELCYFFSFLDAYFKDKEYNFYFLVNESNYDKIKPFSKAEYIILINKKDLLHNSCKRMNKKEASDEISNLLNKAANIALKNFGDNDIFNYGRAYEYLMANKLWHTISNGILGDDGIDESIKDWPNGIEYKTRAHPGYLKNGSIKPVSFTYGGIARVDNYEEQVELIRKKILSSAYHCWGIKSSSGFDIDIIYKVSSEVVFNALLDKLQNKWDKKKQKDPRILINISVNDIIASEIVYKNKC